LSKTKELHIAFAVHIMQIHVCHIRSGKFTVTTKCHTHEQQIYSVQKVLQVNQINVIIAQLLLCQSSYLLFLFLGRDISKTQLKTQLGLYSNQRT